MDSPLTAREAAVLQLKKVIGLCHNQIERKQEDNLQREEPLPSKALRGSGKRKKNI